MKKTLPVLAIIFTSLVWGISIPLTKFLLLSVPPFTLAFIRFTIAAGLAFSFSQFKGLKLVDISRVGIFALFGITLNIGLFLLGLKSTNSLDASLLVALAPVITIFIAVAFAQERIKLFSWLGILISFFGAFIYFVLPSVSNHGGFNLYADFLIFLSIVASAVYIIAIKKLFKIYRVTQITAISFLVGSLSFLPPAISESLKIARFSSLLTIQNILGLLFLGVFTSFIAYWAVEWGLSRVSVHLTAIISYLTPVFAVLFTILFLGERLSPLFLVSSFFVALGIFLATFSPHSHHHHLHKF